MAVRYCCFGFSRSTTTRRRVSGIEDAPESPLKLRLFSYNELMSATGNFNPLNRIGRGGFGIVYKGTLRDGTQIAVKSLSAESKQGTDEFLTEIVMVSKVRHPNLVQLLGCCVQGRNRMLVYEYLENNSLANALLGPWSKKILMGWPTRAAICMGTARGLAYLHEEAEICIVHRDIKASNVLLDKNLMPKIGDFGLAKLFPESVSHISTRVAGTIGYLAPEYALFGQLTKKADIYSFGVLVLEIISGSSSSRNVWGDDLKFLLEWAWSLRNEDKLLLGIVDPALVGYPEEEVLRFIKVALLCTQAASQQRPTMKQVLGMLSEDVALDVTRLAQPGVIRDGYQVAKKSGSGSSSAERTPITKKNSFSISMKKTQSFPSSLSTVELMPR